MEEEYIQTLLKLASEVKELKEKGIAELSNDLNLIDEIHINENANTKILLKLLQYKEDEKYPFLISFLKRMSCDFPIQEVSKPDIIYGKEYIDGLVEERGKYGIIIENKIYWAADQNKQIEDYVNKVKGHGINQECIYVIYLTSDGNKKVEDYSFTKEAKDALEYTDAHNPGRFVEMNYRDHILPWLKEDVLHEINEENAITISAVHQYIDYLEGFFNLRKRESQIYNDMRDKILKSLSIDPESFNETKFSYETWKKLDDSQKDVEELRNEIVNIKTSIEQPIIKLWECMPKSFGYQNITNQLKNGYFELEFDNIDRKCLHFEWFPCYIETLFKDNKLQLVLHAEGGEKGEYMKQLKQNDEFNKVAGDAGFKFKYQGSTVGSMKIDIPEGKTFAELTVDEQKEFLNDTYTNISQIKKIIEDLFNSSKNKEQEK